MAKTVQQLIARARNLAGSERTDYLTPQEYEDLCNDARLDLYDRIVAKYQGHYTKAFDFALLATPTGNAATLPLDFYIERGVTESPDQSGMRTINPLASFPERNNPYETAYELDGNSIKILPYQSAAHTYRLEYVPIPQRLKDPTLIVQAGDGVVASSRTFTFQGYTFDSTYNGASLVISGTAIPGNSGTFTVGSAGVHTLTINPGPTFTDESFNPDTVLASCLPSGVDNVLDQIMTPWELYIPLYVAIAAREKREMDTTDLELRFNRLCERVDGMTRRRTQGVKQVPIRRDSRHRNIYRILP